MIIIENIYIESSCLDSNIKNHLFNKLIEEKEGVCTKKYGIIKKIIQLNSIIDSHISMANGGNCFKVEYVANTLKPEQGEIMANGTIIAVFSDGMFVDFNDFQILVCQGIFDEKTTNYKFKCGCKFKTTDGSGTVKILETEFKDGKFSCIGQHIC